MAKEKEDALECALDKEDLLRCLYLVQGVVEKRSSLPILSHVLIEGTEETVSLGATDLEVGIRQQCKAAVKKSGAVTPTTESRDGKKIPVSVSLPGNVLGEMIEKTLFATSPDETRLNLSGVYLEAQQEGKLRMVASDGHRLAIIEREAGIT